jgi:hypothetical protein
VDRGTKDPLDLDGDEGAPSRVLGLKDAPFTCKDGVE